MTAYINFSITLHYKKKIEEVENSSLEQPIQSFRKYSREEESHWSLRNYSTVLNFIHPLVSSEISNKTIRHCFNRMVEFSSLNWSSNIMTSKPNSYLIFQETFKTNGVLLMKRLPTPSAFEDAHNYYNYCLS